MLRYTYLRTMSGPPLSPLQVDSVPSGPLKVQITSSRITMEMALKRVSNFGQLF